MEPGEQILKNDFKNKENICENKFPKSIYLESDVWNVFSTSWIRRLIQSNNELDRILLDSRWYILYAFSILFYIILYFS